MTMNTKINREKSVCVYVLSEQLHDKRGEEEERKVFQLHLKRDSNRWKRRRRRETSGRSRGVGCVCVEERPSEKGLCVGEMRENILSE